MNISETTKEILSHLKQDKSLTVMTDGKYRTIITTKISLKLNKFNAVALYYTEPYGFYISEDGETLRRWNDRTEKTAKFSLTKT